MMNERYKNNPDLPMLNWVALNNLLPLVKQEYPHLKESDSSSLQVDNQTLIQSWKNFFANPKQFGKPSLNLASMLDNLILVSPKFKLSLNVI